MTSRLNLSGPFGWPGGYALLAAERRRSSARSELDTPSRWLARVNKDGTEHDFALTRLIFEAKGIILVSGGHEGGG